MGKLKLFSSDVKQTCRHLDVEHSIYDEDYEKTNVLFGVFRFVRTFTLRHIFNTPKSTYKETNIPGFRNKID